LIEKILSITVLLRTKCGDMFDGIHGPKGIIIRRTGGVIRSTSEEVIITSYVQKGKERRRWGFGIGQQ